MKIKFLNKIDSAIFKNFNSNHEAITGEAFVHALIGGAIIALVVFAMQMFNVSQKTMEVITGIGILALLGWITKLSLPTITAFPGWGARISYSIYTLVLTGLAITIAIWMVMIVLVILFLYGIIKIFFSSSSSKSSARFVYRDGTEVKAKKTGTGICGEEYYEGENGDRGIK